MTRRVVLLHGLWMPGVAMRWLAGRLSGAGYAPEIFTYTSIVGGPDVALPRLIARLSAAPCHVVAHSLGGLLALSALQRQPDLPVERMVCLGSSLRGSAAASALAQRGGWHAAWLGRSATLLRDGCLPWHGATQVGMIAGRRARGLGQYFGGFPGDNDGTVAVDETRLDGLADHVVVDASHSGLLFSEQAAALTVVFLRDGRFVESREPVAGNR